MHVVRDSIYFLDAYSMVTDVMIWIILPDYRAAVLYCTSRLWPKRLVGFCFTFSFSVTGFTRFDASL
jgi:hypothetical protein